MSSFTLNAVLVGRTWRHNRATDHTGTQDDTTVVLGTAIGQYPVGTTVHDVLVSLSARLDAISSTNTTVRTFSVNAVIQPHFFVRAALRRGQTGTFTVDARMCRGGTLTLNALVRRTTAGSFTANASLV